MFTVEELGYLLECIQAMPVTSTQQGRNKGAMTVKVCNLIDEVTSEAEKAEEVVKKGKKKDA